MTTATTTLPLKPLPTEHRAGLDIAIGQRAEIEALAARSVGGRPEEHLPDRERRRASHRTRLFQYLLERGTARFPTFAFSANELIYRDPAALGPGILVLVCVQYRHDARGRRGREVRHRSTARRSSSLHAPCRQPARRRRAMSRSRMRTTRAIGDPKQAAQRAHWASRSCASLATSTPATYDAHVRALEALPDALLDGRAASPRTLNHRIADALKDEPIIYVLGSGPERRRRPTAWPCATCRRCSGSTPSSFDAAEFLHGAMEVVTDDTAVILFLGEEATRPIDERAKAFLDTYTKKAYFVDARDLDLAGDRAGDAALRLARIALVAVMSPARRALRGGARARPPRPAATCSRSTY